jgi:hypothetical protein
VNDHELDAAVRAEQVAGDYYPHRPQHVNTDAAHLRRAAAILREGAPDDASRGTSDVLALARLLDAVGEARLRGPYVDATILDTALTISDALLERGSVVGR